MESKFQGNRSVWRQSKEQYLKDQFQKLLAENSDVPYIAKVKRLKILPKALVKLHFKMVM